MVEQRAVDPPSFGTWPVRSRLPPFIRNTSEGEHVEYLKLDPDIDSNPEVMMAGWCAARFYELLLKVSARKDLHGRIPRDFQNLTWLARMWNLTPADASDPNAFMAKARDQAISGGLVTVDGEDWLLRGWEKYYRPAKSGAQRQAEYEGRERAKLTAATIKPVSPDVPAVSPNATDETDATPPTPPTPPTHSTSPTKDRNRDCQKVFEHWRTKFQKSGNAIFGSARKSKVEARLNEGFSVEDLMTAIEGCALTPWNNGDNPDGQMHNDLELICRSAAQVDRFMQNAKSPPKPKPRNPNGRAPESDKDWSKATPEEDTDRLFEEDISQ